MRQVDIKNFERYQITDDNRAENLKWCTQEENMNNPLTAKLMKQTFSNIERNRKISEKMKGEQNHRFGKEGYWKGKIFTNEHKRKLSESHLK